MRSEHRATADEIDMRAGFFDPATGQWRYWYKYVQRAGVRKKIKRRSHKIDRAQAKRNIEN